MANIRLNRLITNRLKSWTYKLDILTIANNKEYNMGSIDQTNTAEIKEHRKDRRTHMLNIARILNILNTLNTY